MDKCVYKCVDKLEDNCVDNQNISLDKDLAWLKMWSEYLVQTPFNLRERNSEQIRDMLQALIEASLQGDSGLAISSSDVAQLGKFAVHESQAAQTVAPWPTTTRCWRCIDIGRSNSVWPRKYTV